jgi:hypothetical protein
MPFNINDFIQGTRNGFAREAHFELIIPLPAILNRGVNETRKLTLFCPSAQLGGRSIEVTTISRGGLGFKQPFAVGTDFTDFSVDFYCESDGGNLRLLHDWLDKIYSFETGSYNLVEYSDNYTTTMSLLQYNITGKKINEWKIYDAFPKVLSPLTFNWGSRDTILQIPATFSYSRYEYDKASAGVTSINGETKPTPRSRLPQTQTIKL